MPIFKGSRYEGVNITGVTQADNTIASFLHDRPEILEDEIGEDFQLYAVQSGDTLDSLAYNFSGKARLWWIIADINKVFDVHAPLPPGTILKIPNQTFFLNR